MTKLDLHFANGREVLNAYWGYLAGGGITLTRHERARELKQGQAILLHLHIGSQRAFSIHGTVASTSPDRTLIAFGAEDTQNRLLMAALAERALDMEARLSVSDTAERTETKARLFVLSEDGCCLRLNPESAARVAVGTKVAIEAGDLRIVGYVISANEDIRCVIFGKNDSAALEAVRACVRAP